MGAINFVLPESALGQADLIVRSAVLAEGFDRFAIPTSCEIRGATLSCRKEREDSAFLYVPWIVEGFGHLMCHTTTMRERGGDYDLAVELARGKLNQLRNQMSDWEHAGLIVPPIARELVQKATRFFGQAVLDYPSGDYRPTAEKALALAHEAAASLCRTYSSQLLWLRHQHLPRFETTLGCRVRRWPNPELQKTLCDSFNSIRLPLAWDEIEPEESKHVWSHSDAVLEFAEQNGFNISAGPLIDFNDASLPKWIQRWAGDLPSIAGFMCDYLEVAMNRYRDRFSRWVICSGGNSARCLQLSSDDCLRLTARLVEAARELNPSVQLIVGLSHPWGGYLKDGDLPYSPFVFADTLLRAGMPIHGFELELHMAAGPRGEFCRDLMETNRIIDLYAILGLPLHVSISYPSSSASDPMALGGPAIDVQAWGHWGGFSTESQARWAESVASLLVSRPEIASVTWKNWDDRDPHLTPNSGLVDAYGAIKPATASLAALKNRHLMERFLEEPVGDDELDGHFDPNRTLPDM